MTQLRKSLCNTDRPRPTNDTGWLIWRLPATCYLLFARLGHPQRYVRGLGDLEPVRVAATEDMQGFFAIPEQGIAAGPWFLERGFTALNIYLAMLVG